MSAVELSPDTQKPGWIRRSRKFIRAQISNFLAAIVDFGTLAIWVEVFHLHYTAGVAVGATLGAVTNFTINRYWSFEAAHFPVGGQMRRYALVSFGSLLLNVGGVYCVTEFLHVQYLISKVVVSFLVSVGYNYPFHRHWVYQE